MRMEMPVAGEISLAEFCSSGSELQHTGCSLWGVFVAGQQHMVVVMVDASILCSAVHLSPLR